MTTRSRRITVVVTTLLTALALWLFFELVRTPYRPPHDMLTFLGTEKYGVFQLMGVLFVGWLALTVYLGATSRFTIRDYLVFTGMIAVLLAAGGYVATHPHRPVTPFNRLLK